MSNALRNWKNAHLIIHILHSKYSAAIIVLILVAMISGLACSSKEETHFTAVNDDKTILDIYAPANLKNNPILFHTFISSYDSYFYLINADGSNLTKLNEFNIYALRICETNPIILSLSKKEERNNIYRMNGNGELILLTNEQRGGEVISDYNPLSPNKNKIVYKTHDEETGCEQICLMDSDGNNKITIFDNLTTDIDASWSLNGQYLAIQTGEKSYVIDVNTINFREFPNAYDLAWSPDSKMLLFKANTNNNYKTASENSDLYVYDIETMKSKRISGGDFIRPHWLDDEHIAVINNNTICVVDKNGDNMKSIAQIDNSNDYIMYWAPNNRACLIDNRKEQKWGPTKSKLQLITFDSTWSTKEFKYPEEYDDVKDIYWAPNSQKIIFVSKIGESRFINCLEIDKAVINTSAVDGPYFGGVITKPWSKDSSLFVFSCFYLYIYDTINNTVIKITNSTGHCCPSFIY
jgi:Tol biopolymer transport system component